MKLQLLFRRIARIVLVILVGLGIQAIAHAGDPPEEELDENNPQVQEVIAAQDAVTADLMQSEDVLGTAVGLQDAGRPALVVYIDSDSPSVADTTRALPPHIRRALPPHLRGVGVKIEVTDKFRAFTPHTAKQTPPIQLGTSGGWSYDLANGYCCGGTLGSLILVNGTNYIMSNYHVLESDIVLGGNGIVANTGDPIIQPGLIDVNCDSSVAQVVGSLVKLSSLPDSNVDVGIAQVSPGMVSTNGAILEIGTISKNTVSPKLRKGVKKSGRTTGLTTSRISGLNATISVTYANECAGGTAFTKTFTGQIVVSNQERKFLDSGDSGSLMVENVSTNPRAVGLLYAGSSTTAIANPIGPVLQFVGSKLGGTATMVGN